MTSRRDEVMQRWLAGLSAIEIAQELGVNRNRVYQLLGKAEAPGPFEWYVETYPIHDYNTVVIRTNAPEAVAAIVQRALARAQRVTNKARNGLDNE
jgi:hypothetical protein